MGLINQALSLVGARAPAPPGRRPGFRSRLQGGGSFGAFTWGVLDRLLEREIAFDAISGASAGAVNAVLARLRPHPEPRGSARGARRFWRRMSRLRRLPAGDFADARGHERRLRPVLRRCRPISSIRSISILCARRSPPRSISTPARALADEAAGRRDARARRPLAHFPRRRTHASRPCSPPPACRSSITPSRSTASPIGTAAMSPIRR